MKIQKIQLLAIFILFNGILVAQKTNVSKPAIIPHPTEISWEEGSFLLPERAVICYNSGAKQSAAWLQKLLSNTYVESYMMTGGDCLGFSIELKDELHGSLGEEGYELKITENTVYLTAATNSGLFYAIQTFRQMLPSEIEKRKISDPIRLPQVEIKDKPRFGWRGSMIDIARSFFGPEYLKKHIDRMALYKLNKLHLHLTDDQGWRIEIKSKPKLTEVGGKSAVKNGRSGFLTQEEYKELQTYAKARNITIIPEIDMPGHIYAALIAYPELNCEEFSNLEPRLATPPQLFHEYTVGWSKFCLEKPEIYDFVSEVIAELSEITTGEYIHIGGDEIEDDRYKEFVVKADSIVRMNGKTTIGWEEVTQAPVNLDFISQRWNGKTENVVDVRIIESICTNFYFDHANVPGQENTNNWCQERGVSLEDAYNFNPDNPNVIGVEAPVWTELITSDDIADNRLWPRTIATSEVGWTVQESKDFTNFKERLGHHGDRLDYLDINYFASPDIEWNVDRGEGVFSGFMPEAE
ncbi:beta-N-acetylhexosaminidase [Christiangramia crocea]|uniref:beta-N-acetylhexosaminidase n=1 Tax=Christiangramia crocea TaxID=2904124 RepID=A0A9X1UW48_9FLAO|nr:beta-N-acetylhexosaminidase [Gramella crocea]MCG9971442.1 beta-N-acetylhexosaminidase [Gramella crocea]